MYFGLKSIKGYSGVTWLTSNSVDSELFELETRGFIRMYFVEDHSDHTHYFIQLNKGVSIRDSAFNILFAESYGRSIKLTKLKDFISYMKLDGIIKCI